MEGSVEKLETVLQLLNTFYGHVRERSLETIELLFAPIFSKLSQIPIPTSNTSEI